MAISPIIESSLISKICIGFLAPIAFMLSSVSAAADQQTADAQRLLNNLGYNAGAVDGAWGKKTRTALEQFYADRNQRFDGKLDEQELALLNSEYAKLFADMPPDRVMNWDQINGTTRTETLDCRGDQKGLVWVRDHPTIKSDWILNNDFGQYTYGKNKVPPLKSCIYRDGTGWEFNQTTKVYKGKDHVIWLAQSMTVGAKGWGNPANLYNTKDLFPVRVGDIEKLDYSIDYTYQIDGQSIIHVALWFIENPNNEPAGRLYLFRPKTEVMLKIGANHPGEEWWSRNCGPHQHKDWQKLNIKLKDGGKLRACMKRRPAGEGMDWTVSIWMNDIFYENQVGRQKHEFDLKEVIQQLKKNKVVGDDEYLLGIEFNDEVYYGKGKMKIHSLDYELVTK